MDFDAAAKIVGLRPALEAMIVRATTNPEAVSNPGPQEQPLMAAFRALSKVNAGKFGIAQEENVAKKRTAANKGYQSKKRLITFYHPRDKLEEQRGGDFVPVTFGMSQQAAFKPMEIKDTGKEPFTDNLRFEVNKCQPDEQRYLTKPQFVQQPKEREYIESDENVPSTTQISNFVDETIEDYFRKNKQSMTRLLCSIDFTPNSSEKGTKEIEQLNSWISQRLRSDQEHAHCGGKQKSEDEVLSEYFNTLSDILFSSQKVCKSEEMDWIEQHTEAQNLQQAEEMNFQSTGRTNLQKTGAKNLRETEEMNFQQTGRTNLQKTGAKNLRQTEGMNFQQTEEMNLQEADRMNLQQTGRMNFQQTGRTNLQKTGAKNLRQTEGMNFQRTEGTILQKTGAKILQQTELMNFQQTEGTILQKTGAKILQQTEGMNFQQTEGKSLQQADRLNLQQTEGWNLQQTGGTNLQQTGGKNLQPTGGINLQQTQGVDLRQTEGVDLRQTEGVTLQQTGGMNLQHTGGVNLQVEGLNLKRPEGHGQVLNDLVSNIKVRIYHPDSDSSNEGVVNANQQLNDMQINIIGEYPEDKVGILSTEMGRASLSEQIPGILSREIGTTSLSEQVPGVEVDDRKQIKYFQPQTSHFLGIDKSLLPQGDKTAGGVHVENRHASKTTQNDLVPGNFMSMNKNVKDDKSSEAALVFKKIKERSKNFDSRAMNPEENERKKKKSRDSIKGDLLKVENKQTCAKTNPKEKRYKLRNLSSKNLERKEKRMKALKILNDSEKDKDVMKKWRIPKVSFNTNVFEVSIDEIDKALVSRNFKVQSDRLQHQFQDDIRKMKQISIVKPQPSKQLGVFDKTKLEDSSVMQFTNSNKTILKDSSDRQLGSFDQRRLHNSSDRQVKSFDKRFQDSSDRQLESFYEPLQDSSDRQLESFDQRLQHSSDGQLKSSIKTDLQEASQLINQQEKCIAGGQEKRKSVEMFNPRFITQQKSSDYQQKKLAIYHRQISRSTQGELTDEQDHVIPIFKPTTSQNLKKGKKQSNQNLMRSCVKSDLEITNVLNKKREGQNLMRRCAKSDLKMSNILNKKTEGQNSFEEDKHAIHRKSQSQEQMACYDGQKMGDNSREEQRKIDMSKERSKDNVQVYYPYFPEEHQTLEVETPILTDIELQNVKKVTEKRDHIAMALEKGGNSEFTEKIVERKMTPDSASSL